MMPRLRIPRPFAAALGTILVVSCTNPIGVCGCPPARNEAVLYGRVTDPAGNLVAGASVRAEVGTAGCASSMGELGRDDTDAAGQYRAMIYSLGGVTECLRAYALPPAGSTLRGSDTVTFEVTFAYPRATDSARVDLVLRAP